ncbi:MAG: TonB-dependent receptor [Bacteroidales bacterium]|nr:TonB-dependent receptor [Bacteroidales bacterium]
MKYNITIILLLITFGLSAQGGHPGGGMNKGDMPKDAVIKGIVKDDQYKTPVKFANVALLSARDSSVVAGVVCDENGYFEMKDLSYGRYYIIVDFIGYEKINIDNIKLYPKQKEKDLGTVYLKHVAENIEEVEIIGERNFIEYKIDRKVINISKNINASGGTIADALENAPSIQVDIDGNVTMRGSSNFKVLIDGKPTVLDANDILQQIPASSVENIEIITNPSVKYDPDGTTGILNIIMKKESRSGFNGVVNASIGTGDKYSSDFLLNYRAKKANYYFGMNYGDRTRSGTGSSMRETYLNDTTNFLISESERNHQRKYYSVKGGVDLFLNDNNTVSFSGRYGYFGFGRETNSQNYEYTFPGTTNIYSFNEGIFEVGGDFYFGNIDFTHNFNKKDHEIYASVQYSGRTGGIENNISENQTDENYSETLSSEKYRTFQDRRKKILRLKLDYTYPVSEKMKFEAGYQSRLRNTPGDYIHENYVSGDWILDETYSNKYTYIRNIHSVYSSLSGEIIGMQYMLGLRGEYTDRLVEQITSGETYPLQRFDYFPSLHLTKELSKSQQIQVSYSKRVNRPRHWYMNPFSVYSDSYYVRVGNPALLPEYIDSYELSYNKRIKKSFFNIEAYYRQTNNKISRVQELLDDGRILNTFNNLDKEYAYGSELSGNFQLLKWWMMYANANVYRYNIEGETAGITTNSKSTNYDFRLNSTFIFAKTGRLQLNGFYNAPTVTSQGNREGFYFFGAAYKHEFFKRRLSVVVNARDIFRTGKYVYTSEGEGFITENERRREAPVITLSLSYKINNYKQKRGERDEDANEYNDGMM